ncbi:Brain and acute leukemia cytoplasmic protein [Bienertia sinuspersici]
MGNCSMKSSTKSSNKDQTFIRIMTDSGRVIEIQGPKLAQEVLDQFPGYGIYQKGHLSLPLFEDELLFNGQVYYLFPFGVSRSYPINAKFNESMSFRNDQNAAFEVLPSKGNGVWRVKMAIDSKELEDMLSENAEGLIQKMRSVAKASEKSPERSFRWRSIANGLKSPVNPRKLTAC